MPSARSVVIFAAAALLAPAAAAQSPPKAAAKDSAASRSALAEGRFGKALDARVASAIVRGHAELRTPPITVSCWARLTQKKEYNILVASETKYSALHWELFTVAGTGKFTAFLSGMKPDHVRSDVDICDDRWHHLAMVYEPDRVRLYVDAKEVASQAIAPSGRTGRFEDIAIGSLLEGGFRCTGLIDEVHIESGTHPVAKLPEKAVEAGKETVGLWHFDREDSSPAAEVGRISNPSYTRFADASSAKRHAAPSYIVRSSLEVPPRCLDDRLTIELFAKEPDIVTPVGIVVDERDRLLVLESNTHFPPKGYSRHPSDRILWLQDTNSDGRADKFTVFADGFTAAMHMTSHPDGSLYVATRGSIIRLRDKDGDGVADERTTLVRLETTCTYPHNGLFSVAFDWLDRMYISMGENLGADFKLIGSDGSVVTGGGEGGNIFRATADGGKVERHATGFWNPVQLHFDVFGRLFTVDNDPDSRPPCRLLHIVPGGDYGYRYRNGRAGLHPFTAWNGELPGTLPMVAGTGEAPSGLITCEFAGWPEEHRGKMLVTSWGDYRIDIFTLERRGASFRGSAQPLVTGGDDFRPVAMAIDRNGQGHLYVTDWVDKSYEVHLKGRVWRIRPKEAAPKRGATPGERLNSSDRRVRERAARTLTSATSAGRGAVLKHHIFDKEDAFDAIRPGDRGADERKMAAVLGAMAARFGTMPEENWATFGYQRLLGLKSSDVQELVVDLFRPSNDALFDLASGLGTVIPRPAPWAPVQSSALSQLIMDPKQRSHLRLLVINLDSEDPFRQTAARQALRHSPQTLLTVDDLKLTEPRMQVGMLLARREANYVGMTSDIHRLPKYLESPDESVRFVTTQWIGEARLKQHRDSLLAALDRPGQSAQMFAATLTALALVDGAKSDEANTGGRVYLERILNDATTSAALKARALRRLPGDSKALAIDRLQAWMTSEDPALRLEAVRSMRTLPDTRRFDVLGALAADKSKPAELRAEAIAGLADDGRDASRSFLLRLADVDTGTLGQEALRSLRGRPLTAAEREALSRLPDQRDLTLAEREQREELVRRVLEPEKASLRAAADATDAWLKLLDGPADAAAGERIFYHSKSAACFRCHRFDGRGSDIGPDLSLTARTMDRRKLVESILQPSKEIAPQFFVWQVQTDDGRTFTGTLVGESANGDQTYADAEGKLITVRRREIANKASQRRSVMPDDVAKMLTLQEFRDVLAFLQQGSGEPKVSGKPSGERGASAP
jgi:putative membrane-bound dehydrogenase-like protein